MGKNDKTAYLEAIRRRYRKASRADKAKILDEFCEVRQYDHKSTLRLLRRPSRKAASRQPGRPSQYRGAEVMVPLRAIWRATD